MYVELEEAVRLREKGMHRQANELLMKLAEIHKKDGETHYHCAWSFDVLGKEKEAVPYYEKAIHLGLKPADLKGAYVGLGSTYRTLGRYKKAIETFEKGLCSFPDDPALNVFYSMALYNTGRHQESMYILLQQIISLSNHDEIKRYERAINLYSSQLDRIWQ